MKNQGARARGKEHTTEEATPRGHTTRTRGTVTRGSERNSGAANIRVQVMLHALPNSAMTTWDAEHGRLREASQKHAEEHRKDHAERGTVKQQVPAPSTSTVSVKLGTGPKKARTALVGHEGSAVVATGSHSCNRVAPGTEATRHAKRGK